VHRLAQRRGEVVQLLGRVSHSPSTSAMKRSAPLPVVAQQLAPGEVERLHAVGALVEHRHPRIADDLLHAPFGDVAVPAEHLLHRHRGLEAPVGAVALDHRGQQHDQRLGLGALGFARGVVRQVDLVRGPQHERAEALGEGPASISIRRTSGWTISGSAGALLPGALPCLRSSA
jgi:hypothetical protein